ncbi:MAG: DUF1579 family protein [Caldilineaceae bacterium]
MDTLSALVACRGQWRGNNTLQDPETGQPAVSAATATVTPLLDGRFVRLDYTWHYGDTPQAGSLLIGHDTAAGTLSAYWIDSWHMGDKAMLCQGAATGQEELVVRGAYAAPPGPDWGWRIAIIPGAGTALRLVMHNIWPDGKEELAVEARYERV